MSLNPRIALVVLGAFVAAGSSAFLASSPQTSQAEAAPPAKQKATKEKTPATDKADEKPTLSDFMYEKMDASHDIMEGLLLEDSKLIHNAAKKLKEMSETERWRVSNDIMYRNHSEDFRNSVDKLIVAAKGKSIDRAALSWFDVTLICIDCHRYVRTVLIAETEHSDLLD